MARITNRRMRELVAQHWHKRMKALGISQKKLAEKIGISRIALNYNINGKSTPSATTVALVEDELGKLEGKE